MKFQKQMFFLLYLFDSQSYFQIKVLLKNIYFDLIEYVTVAKEKKDLFPWEGRIAMHWLGATGLQISSKPLFVMKHFYIVLLVKVMNLSSIILSRTLALPF